ncbi:hypothetical protein GBA52_013733 [Prunus armeniaca]|nr:hypothetical protein GBA52_013733 [Prunus armeniaca]
MIHTFHPYSAASTGIRNFSTLPSSRRSTHGGTLEPRFERATLWNHIFVICIIGLFLDPIYFFLPIIGESSCMKIDTGFQQLD